MPMIPREEPETLLRKCEFPYIADSYGYSFFNGKVKIGSAFMQDAAGYYGLHPNFYLKKAKKYLHLLGENDQIDFRLRVQPSSRANLFWVYIFDMVIVKYHPQRKATISQVLEETLFECPKNIDYSSYYGNLVED
jgi:hypothetical protein